MREKTLNILIPSIAGGAATLGWSGETSSIKMAHIPHIVNLDALEGMHLQQAEPALPVLQGVLNMGHFPHLFQGQEMCSFEEFLFLLAEEALPIPFLPALATNVSLPPQESRKTHHFLPKGQECCPSSQRHCPCPSSPVLLEHPYYPRQRQTGKCTTLYGLKMSTRVMAARMIAHHNLWLRHWPAALPSKANFEPVAFQRAKLVGDLVR